MALAEIVTQRATSPGLLQAGAGVLAVPEPVTPGLAIVVGGATWGATAAPSSVTVTDTIGTAYTVILSGVTGTTRTFLAVGLTTAEGSTSVSVDPVGADPDHRLSYSLTVRSGVVAPLAITDGGSTGGQASAAPSDTLTPALAGDLVLGVVTHGSAATTIGVSGGLTLVGALEANSGTQCHGLAYRVAGSGLQTVAFAFGASSVDGIVQTVAVAATRDARRTLGSGLRPRPFQPGHPR